MRGNASKGSPQTIGRRGFTLIELLVVVGIVIVLLSLLFPALSRLREHSKRAICLSNLRQLGAAALAYATDHDGYWPQRPSNAPWPPQVVAWPTWVPTDADCRPFWVGYLPGYTIASSSPYFYCPSNNEPGLLNSPSDAWSGYYANVYVLGYSYFAAYHIPGLWVASVPISTRVNSRHITAIFGDTTESYLDSSGQPWSYAAHSYIGGIQWVAPGSMVHPEGMNCVMSDGSARWFGITVDSTNRVTAMSDVEPCVNATHPGFYWGKPTF